MKIIGHVAKVGETLGETWKTPWCSKVSGGFRWVFVRFCFRIRQMKVGTCWPEAFRTPVSAPRPYTFHLTGLIKPGSLFVFASKCVFDVQFSYMPIV